MKECDKKKDVNKKIDELKQLIESLILLILELGTLLQLIKWIIQSLI